jgi:3-oxoacyl-[acyl-carrier protein] reductase
MDLGLRDRAVLVTGSSRGIGHAIAAGFAAEGARVALCARGADALEAAREKIGGRSSAHAGDLTQAHEARRIVNEVIAEHGALDVLVCNIGSGRSVPPGEETHAEWRRVLDLNLHTTTNAVEAARTQLAHARGAIVCISSICGLEALGAPVTYSAAKAALHAYVRGMARPLARNGVRINAVAPGNVLTEDGIWAQRRNEDPAGLQEKLQHEVALGRLAAPEEIAAFAVFLASKPAAFATGAVFTVDGGQVRS